MSTMEVRLASFFFSSRRRHTRYIGDWSSDVCSSDLAGAEAARLGLGAGIAGGLLSAVSYALTTLMARFAVPRYGAVRVLFLEAIGGVVILGIVLTLAGRAPTPPPSLAAWRGLVALTAGPVRRLRLPNPEERRECAGTPGPRYWQQRADYTIRATLDTATHTIAGSETLRYANNSPDTLHYLWLQLDQNIYKANSRGASLNPTDARFAGRGFEGGYTIQYVRAVRRRGQASGL